MNEIIVTFIDSSNWQNGINWLRQIKSLGFSVTILIDELDDQQKNKIIELGFPTVSIIHKYNDHRDIFISIELLLDSFDKCLFCKCGSPVPTSLPKTFDLVVSKHDIELYDLVLPIVNLQNRGKAYKTINEKIVLVKNQLLSSNCIYGTKDFWQNFIAFLKLSYDEGYVEKRDFCDDLVLNLYVAFFESLNYEVIC